MTVVAKNITDPSSFPQQVQDLINILSVPHAHDAAALRIPTAKSCDDGAAEAEARHVDLLKQISVTCAGIQQLLSIQDDLGPRQTRPVWHNFMQLLTCMLHEDTIGM